MSRPLACPPVDTWELLLGATLPPEQREPLERHLETCPGCQERLDRAEGGSALLTLVQHLTDPAIEPADPILSRVLEQLHEAKYPERVARAEPVDLYFLRPAEPPLLGFLEEYEVQEVIGQGGFGVVLKAHEPALQRLVAIKVLSPALAGSLTARKRFTREAQAAAAVCHEHIVAVHAVREVEGLPYLVTQYVAGESLQDRLDRAGPLPVEDMVRIGLQTAQGLAAAHAQGLIHRDIKPANLLLEVVSCQLSVVSEDRRLPSSLTTDNWQLTTKVKITDFGLARMVDDVSLTQNGVVAGTPQYMAPEQANGEPIDHRADLFSLGSVLYALCTGAPPFQGESIPAVLLKVCTEQPPPLRSLLPDVPAWLEAFIARLMARDPSQRFQNATEAAGLLEDYLAHLRQPGTIGIPELPSVAESSPAVSPRNPSSSGVAGWRRPGGWMITAIILAGTLIALAGLELVKGIWWQMPAVPEPATYREFHHDFRGGRPLHSALMLVGPEIDQVSRSEAEGLRITLPADRPVHYPVEVAATFAVGGDFEITLTCELLSATQPTSGYGAGVSLCLADSDKRVKFAKVGRVRLVKVGSVFQAESWNNQRQNSWRSRTRPTEARLGRLRLERKGSRVRYLAAEGLDGDFHEIFVQDDFGTDELTHVHLGVADSGSPGIAVDVRLLDFTIHAARLTPDPTPDTAPADPAAAAPTATPRPGSRTWLLPAVILGGLLLSALVVCLVVFRSRRSGSAATPNAEKSARDEAPGPALSINCPGCGKTCKVKSALAGKKIRCPGCSQVLSVPA
jgi:serine/threonine-protein kinase